jgi:hypothetical protein
VDLDASAAEMLPLGIEGAGKSMGQRQIWFSRRQFLKPEGHDENSHNPCHFQEQDSQLHRNVGCGVVEIESQSRALTVFCGGIQIFRGKPLIQTPYRARYVSNVYLNVKFESAISACGDITVSLVRREVVPVTGRGRL